MSHDHAHDHVHSHSHAHADGHGERRLLFAFALTTLTLFAEAVGGWWSGSLALLADAGHMLVDAAALLFAWLGAHYARRPADARRSFGYGRLEVLVGYSNALVQFVLVAWIVVEALMRFASPQPVMSGAMLLIALVGLLVNAFVLFVLSSHGHDDLNTAGARLHVLGDLLGSLGAVAAAVLIHAFGWLWSDPLVSVFVSLLILASAWRLLHRSAHILLEGAPEGVDADMVSDFVRHNAVGVGDVHHVHVWQLASGYHVATLHAHAVAGVAPDQVIHSIQGVLRERFGIGHVTVQMEDRRCEQRDCGAH